MLKKNFRNTVIGAFAFALLASGSAGAIILGSAYQDGSVGSSGGGYTGSGGTSQYTVTWDTFTTGLATGKWFTSGYGAYWATNGIVQGYPSSLYVRAPGVNSVSGLPAFSLSIAPETLNGGHPGAFDHMKWLVYMDNNSSQAIPGTTTRYKGFDTASGYVLSCQTQITGQTFGTRYQPFGNKVNNTADDLRLASFAMTTFDPETNMVFNFMFTNKRVYAFYERLPWGRPTWNSLSTKNYAAFSYAIPVASRSTSSKHAVKISYDRSAGIVQWFLDGKEVYRVSQIGRRLSSRKNMLIDLGGIEETVTMRQLDCGMGMFTLLDGAQGQGDGLVRLSVAENYYQPSKGEPYALSFLDNSSLQSNRMWGQGAEFHVAPYYVTNAPAGVVTAEPVYTDPGTGTNTGSDFDGSPVMGDIAW